MSRSFIPLLWSEPGFPSPSSSLLRSSPTSQSSSSDARPSSSVSAEAFTHVSHGADPLPSDDCPLDLRILCLLFEVERRSGVLFCAHALFHTCTCTLNCSSKLFTTTRARSDGQSWKGQTFPSYFHDHTHTEAADLIQGDFAIRIPVSRSDDNFFSSSSIHNGGYHAQISSAPPFCLFSREALPSYPGLPYPSRTRLRRPYQRPSH